MGKHYAIYSTSEYVIPRQVSHLSIRTSKTFMIYLEKLPLLSSEFSYNLKISVSFRGFFKIELKKKSTILELLHLETDVLADWRMCKDFKITTAQKMRSYQWLQCKRNYFRTNKKLWPLKDFLIYYHLNSATQSDIVPE